MTSQAPEARPTTWHCLASFAIRWAVLLMLWFVLSNASAYQLWFGIVVTGAAAMLSMLLAPASGRRVSAVAILRVLPFFFGQALIGGVDVGMRALRRRPLEPTFIDHPLRLRSEGGRLWLVCVVSLLPGTVSCELRDDVLHIHVLDRSMAVQAVLDQLEAHIAAVLRTPLAD